MAVKNSNSVIVEPVSRDAEDQGLQNEQRAVRKLDVHIMPLIMLIYLFSFLDRVNIGNARLFGLEDDLKLVGNQYQILVSILFATYISVELPSNWVIKKIRPSRWIAFITFSWGIIATLSGKTQDFAGMLVCRVLLGAFEGGLFPGLVTYLTFFYTKKELALRIAALFACSALAGATGGLLAFGIGHMHGVGGQNGWRWILIIEGIPTVFLGVAAWFGLADDPSTARYLNIHEKEVVLARLGRQAGLTDSARQFHWKDVREAFLDWKIWLFSFAQFGVDVMLYGYAVFLPTIIQGIDPSYTRELVQVLTIPCYSLGAISYILIGRLSDHQQRRGVWVVLLGTVSVVGYGMLISGGGPAVHYIGCFLVAAGMFVVIGLPLAWLPTNVPRYGKRTTTIAMQAMIGNSAGIMSSFLYPAEDGPRYVKGHAITMGMLIFGVVSFLFMWIYYVIVNKRRADGKEDYKVQGLSDEEIDELGDRSPRFVYVT